VPEASAILHAPADVGGNAYGLSRAERELGLRSDVAVFAPGPFGYGFDIDLHAGIDQPLWTRFTRRAAFLRQAIREYDVFHLNFGLTLLQVRQLGVVLDELAWLKRAGKTVLVTYQGCDVRPKASCPCRHSECFAGERYRRPAAERALQHADRVFFLNPDLRHWLPGGTFVPYASVDPREIRPTPLPERSELVVAHAPTDREVKGTRHVEKAVAKLRREGHHVRLDLIEGVSRDVVLERVAQADVVVDQLLIGWYGAFAVEAMALGRPVLGFIREDEPDDNPFGVALPVVRTTAAALADDLLALAEDRLRRLELGATGRRFVEKHHDPRRIARTVLEGLVELPVATPEQERAPAARAPR